MSNDDPDYVESIYLSLIQDGRIRSLAWSMAENMRESGDPDLAHADQVAALRYLKKCLVTRTLEEVAALTERDAAGLLARGMIGCARYRQRAARGDVAAKPKRRRKRG